MEKSISQFNNNRLFLNANDTPISSYSIGGFSSAPVSDAFVNEYSFNFDGVDDYVDCGDNNNLSFGDGLRDSPFSISAWIKMDSTTGFRILSKYASITNEYSFDTGGGNKLQFYIFDSSSTFKYRARLYNTILNTGQWYHVVATYSGVGGTNAQDGMKIYVDGIRVDDTTLSGGVYVAMGNKTTPVNIGKLDSSYADGNIDEVSIFDSELSASDITTIYNSGVPASLTSLNPLGWWRMGEEATWDAVRQEYTLIDQGSGGNNGLTQNMAEDSRVTDVPPNFNVNSFLFDGIDDIFEGSSIYSEMNGGTKLTLSVWLKPISGSPTLEYVLSNPRDITANNSQFALILYEGNSVQFNVQSRTSQFVSGRIGAITYGAWNHILICVDLSRTIGTEGVIFINGVDETTTSAMGTLSSFYTATDVLHIGVDANGGYNRYNGNIDELSIWSGSDLRSASDVSSIYNSGVPSDLNDTSGIAVPTTYFRMGEQSTFGSQWSMTDINGSYAVTSSNMALASRTTDIP